MKRRVVLRGALGGAALLACRPARPGAVHETAPGRFSQLVGFCDGVAPIGPGEHAARCERGRARLKALGMDALVVEAGESLLYFTGVRWGRSERPLLWVLPVDGAPTFIGPSFEASTLRELIGAAGLRLWREHERAYGLVGQVLAEAKAGASRLAIEPWTRNFVVEGLKVDVPTAELVDGGAVVRGCRMSKSLAELAILRRANEASKAALRAAAALTREGMLETEMAALVRAAQEAAGLTDPWALVLFGTNAAFPHGTRGAQRLTRGALVLVDTGASLHGYRSDITRTWPFGQVSQSARRAFAAVVAAQTAGLAEIRPGQTCGAVDAAARAAIARAGFGPDDEFFTHRLGHGIGLEVHEDPYLVRDDPTILVEGMTMSNEPGVYIPGELGVRLEDIVAVTKDGAEVFGPRATSLESPFGEG